jgi:glutathione S-transferase
MFDSRVIAEYVDSLSPVGKLIPGTGKDRAAIKTWEALADGILDAAILARMEVAWAPRVNAGKVSDAWIERQTEKITRALDVAAKGRGSNAWCHGNQYSLADIALGCALGYLLFRFPNIKWQATHPNLAKHYEKLAKRSAFKETLPPA